MTLSMPSALADPTPLERAVRDHRVCVTSHVDIESKGNGGLVLRGAGHQVRSAGANSEVLATFGATALVANDHLLSHLETQPVEVDTKSLVGTLVGRGFRAAVRTLPDVQRGRAGPLVLLLEDLPTAVLISGYAALYSGKIEIDRRHLRAGLLRPDICSGWRSDGTMLATLEAKGHLPLPVGPHAAEFASVDDAFQWHEIEPLSLGNMRRRRVVEIARSDRVEVFAMFRDTHVDQNNLETVLHEYCFTAALDPDALVFSRCAARPRVLPWRECPAAAASARSLDGVMLDDLPTFVSRELRGTSTCTHLNDLLRSLTAIEFLLPHLP